MYVIAFSYCPAKENVSLNLTVSAKTKGSINSSDGDLCVWNKSPAVKAGCRVKLTARIPTICRQGFYSGTAHGLRSPAELRGCASLSTRCSAGLRTWDPCSRATLHICRWYDISEQKMPGG